MESDDKVSLLSYLVPKFDTGAEDRLEAFVKGLTPTFNIVREKCPSMSEPDVQLQLVGSEMLAGNVLSGGSNKGEFATWVSAMTGAEIEELLRLRKGFKEASEGEKARIVSERDRRAAVAQEEKEAMEQEILEAREKRTVAFNYEKGVFEKWSGDKADLFINKVSHSIAEGVPVESRPTARADHMRTAAVL